MSIVSRANTPHYTWGDGCDGWHLIRDSALSIIQEVMPPGTSEVRHRHRRARPFFFVLSGHATMRVDGDAVELRAGEGIEVGPGLTHQVINQHDSQVEFLVISTPPTAGDREDAV